MGKNTLPALPPKVSGLTNYRGCNLSYYKCNQHKTPNCYEIGLLAIREGFQHKQHFIGFATVLLRPVFGGLMSVKVSDENLDKEWMLIQDKHALSLKDTKSGIQGLY